MNQKQLKRLKRQLKQNDGELLKQSSAAKPRSSSSTQMLAQGSDRRAVKIAKKLHAKIKENLSSQSNLTQHHRDHILAQSADKIRMSAVLANDHRGQKLTTDRIATALISARPTNP